MTNLHKEFLQKNGISPSYTRTMIYDYLEMNQNHPNVDTIFQELSKKLPTLSKTTVYNVLKLFIEKNIVKDITIDSQETKYELVIKKHSHFKCEICNKLFDIPLINTSYEEQSLKGYIINEREVLFKGICPTCQKKNINEQVLLVKIEI